MAPKNITPDTALCQQTLISRIRQATGINLSLHDLSVWLKISRSGAYYKVCGQHEFTLQDIERILEHVQRYNPTATLLDIINWIKEGYEENPKIRERAQSRRVKTHKRVLTLKNE